MYPMQCDRIYDNLTFENEKVVKKGFRAKKGEHTQNQQDKKIGDKATFKTFQGVKK